MEVVPSRLLLSCISWVVSEILVSFLLLHHQPLRLLSGTQQVEAGRKTLQVELRVSRCGLCVENNPAYGIEQGEGAGGGVVQLDRVVGGVGMEVLRRKFLGLLSYSTTTRQVRRPARAKSS